MRDPGYLLTVQCCAAVVSLGLVLSAGVDAASLRWVASGVFGGVLVAIFNAVTADRRALGDGTELARGAGLLGLLALVFAGITLLYTVAIHGFGVGPDAAGAFYIGNMIGIGARVGDLIARSRSDQ